MNRAVKWFLILAGGLVVLCIVALLVAPMFIDVQKYRPMIEEKVTEATGRPFTLGGDLDLSLFPWAGIALSDLHLGNPPGFEKKDFLSVDSFEVRVKLLPLVSRDLQVKKFILEGAQVNLERNKEGRTNWEDLGGAPAGGAKPAEPSEGPTPGEGPGLPLKNLAVGDFSVSGALLYVDHRSGQRREISDLSLTLQDVSFDKPIGIAFTAAMDGKPLELKGLIGPLGQDPMKGTLPVDMNLKALGLLDIALKGTVSDPAAAPRFDFSVKAAPFSPRDLAAQLGTPLPVETSDQETLTHAALTMSVAGGTDEVSISKGVLELDQSKLAFTAKARDFSKPDVFFDMELDRIELDRYLPPPSKKEPSQKDEGKASGEKPAPPDYEPLRRLVLDGTFRARELKAKGMTVNDILVKVAAKGGVLRVDPLSANLYEGSISSNARVDVRGSSPKSAVDVTINDIQAGPLVKDLAAKDIIEGHVRGDISISTTGDQPEAIKKSLNGKGSLMFRDGAIVGVDIPGMVRNVKTAFGVEQQAQDRPKTDFSELNAPFTITSGLIKTPGTELKSPLLRVVASGTADLVSEQLDLRIEPKVVGTLVGQGDTRERTGIQVPVLVTGTFDSPKFRPDLKGIIEKGLKDGVPDAEGLKEMIKPGAKEGAKDQVEEVKDKVKGVLKGFGIK